MLIFLADVVHSSNGRMHPDTVPFGIGRIAAYCQSKHPQHEYRLFKDPHVLLDAIRSQRPDVLGLSNYFWNFLLNHRIARYARSLYPNLTIVTGGPNLDRNEGAYRQYAANHPYVDFVVIEEGETAFESIISQDISGAFAIRDGQVIMGKSLPRVRNLDEFPSPYLNGMLTPFLEQGLRPILETVRGCPYSCAFCEQGSDFFTKIAALSVDRVVEEVEYIRKYNRADQLVLADVNFGILRRDLEVAEFLKKSHQEHGWPRSLYVYNAKLPTETTLRTMETLYPMAQLCMSFQSVDKGVLENIHRSNIGYDKYSFITKWAKQRNLPVGTELIYGLPGETRQSFIDGYETLLNFRADYMASYNLRLFSGIELNSPEKRKQYQVKTVFRPMDVNLGEYQFEQKERILEIEEIVLSSSTLSEEDYFHVRRLAFLVETLWNTGYLRPALAYLANRGFKVMDILQDLLNEAPHSSAAAFFEEYDQLVHEELTDNPQTLIDRAKDDKWWDDLTNGRGVNLKINLAFAGRLLLFRSMVDQFFYDYFSTKYWSPDLDEILAHCFASKVDLDDVQPRCLGLVVDVPEWIKATYPVDIEPFRREVEYSYVLDSEIRVSAMKTRRRLERQGASLNSIAERIFMETPAAHRGTRMAIREGSRAPESSADLEQRMTWAG